MTLKEHLLQRFGPLISISQLATVLDRSPEGLRVSLRAKNEFAQQINKARLKIGGRVYFRTTQIAEVLGQEHGN